MNSLFDVFKGYADIYASVRQLKKNQEDRQAREKQDEADKKEPLKAYDGTGKEIPWPPSKEDESKPPAALITRRRPGSMFR